MAVVVTGAGGPAGIAVIQALQQAGHHTIGVDSSPDAAGLWLADEACTVPPADDPQFATAIDAVVRKRMATALISTIPAEMEHDFSVPHWFPSSWALNSCTDKWAFYKILLDDGVKVPATSFDFGIRGPWVIKPRYGHGSQGVRHVTEHTVLQDDEIVQTRVGGQEFTADCLVGYDGRLLACVPRWRLATRGGISTIGETFVNREVESACYQTLEAVGLTGAANVQGFVNDDGVTIIECNPRFSGGLPLTVAAGANLPAEFLNMIYDKHYVPDVTYRPKVRMTRYFSSIFDG